MNLGLRLRPLVLLTACLAILASCGKEEPKIVFSNDEPMLGEKVMVTLDGSEFGADRVVRIFSGLADGDKTVTPINGHEVSLPLGDAVEIGTAKTGADMHAKVEVTVPFDPALSGKAWSIVAAVEVEEAVKLVEGHTSRSIKKFAVVGPKQPVLGEAMTVKLTATPRSDDAMAYLFRGAANSKEGDESEHRVGDGILKVPLADARLVASKPYKSGKAGFSAAASAESYPEDSRVPFAVVVVEDGVVNATHVVRSPVVKDILVTKPVAVLAVLLVILALLFWMSQHESLGRMFKVLPLLVFCYFVPTVFSNLGVIPIESPLYKFIKTWMLPASLVLLTLSVDIPAIVRLGRQAVGLFLIATLTIVLGGPIAYLCLHGLVPEEMGEEAWKGLAALSGSWIGGTANMVAIGASVGVEDSTFQKMIIVDVAVANVWMAVLLFFAGREKKMDEKIGADRAAIDQCRKTVEDFQAQVQKPTNLPDLLTILAIAVGATVVATWASTYLPPVGGIFSKFTWVVIIVTTVGVSLSFTRLRKLEGSGASKVGSVFLYLLVASIGAHAEFSKIVDAPALVAIGALWMSFHAVLLLFFRWLFKAPIFFAAVGSKANIGGAASAPIVAAAFHPALAPVGILLAVGGYVVGTFAGLLCAFLLKLVHGMVG